MNTLVKKTFGRKFIPRLAKYLIISPDYMSLAWKSALNFGSHPDPDWIRLGGVLRSSTALVKHAFSDNN